MTGSSDSAISAEALMGIDPLVDARGFVNTRGSRQGELSRYDQCGCNFAELKCFTLTFAA
jgi:hypothetical protein